MLAPPPPLIENRVNIFSKILSIIKEAPKSLQTISLKFQSLSIGILNNSEDSHFELHLCSPNLRDSDTCTKQKTIV